MENALEIYQKTLGSKLKGKNISVYGIANYDIIFDITKAELKKRSVNPEFDDISKRALEKNIYKEYNRSGKMISDSVNSLKEQFQKKRILGGNATNISIGLSKLGNTVSLNIKSASQLMRTDLEQSGISRINAAGTKSSRHLIIQVTDANDRFIISPDYGKEEPELVYNQEKSDFAVYSGAHLDAKTPEVQKELIKRLKKISTESPLYIELGSGSRMSQENCKKVSKYADILGMNEHEIKELTDIEDIESAAEQYKKAHMKKDSILLIHTRDGTLAHSKILPPGIEKAIALGNLEGTSRYMKGKYNSFEEIRRLFKKIELYDAKDTRPGMIWLPSIRYTGPGMSVGTGDGFVAGFITGYINFCC